MRLIERVRARIVRQWRQATFRPYVLHRSFAGEEIRFQVGDLFGEDMYGPHHTHWPELEWIKQHGIRAGDTVVDCGANHGFSTVLFSRWTGAGGRVHAFEPFSHNMRILKKNLALNHAANVQCHQVAAGAGPGLVAISAHPNARIVSAAHQPRATEEVSVVALDELLGEQRIAFLKIDVEGHERAVLDGARRLLATKPRLDVELHVAFYQDRQRELQELLDLVLPDRHAVDIQPHVDGPIVPYDRAQHPVSVLAQSDVVHLFCR